MKRIAIVVHSLVLSCLGASLSLGDSMVLVAEGANPTPIILPADAPAETLRAARDLAAYIEKISGTRPEVLDQAPDPAPESAIWIGSHPRLGERFPETDFAFQHPEEILIVCTGRDVLIAGRDRVFGDVQTEYGTANAVYTFIQKHLDVRWLWPGELGEDIVPRKTIALPVGEYRFHPPFLVRGIFRRPGGVLLDWARRQRIALDSLAMDIGHAFNDWWDQYHRDHPEYFALQPDGTRGGFPSPHNVKLCEANPGVWNQWWANVEATVNQDPTATIFSAAPNDGSNAGICICDACRAWDHAEGRPWRMRWSGLTKEYVAMTDRYVTFWNILARGLKERFPGREYYVSGMAYGPARPPPVDARLEDNLVIGYVGHFPIADAAVREREKEEWLRWADKAPKLMFRPNVFWYSGGWHALPTLALRNTMEDFRFLAENSGFGLAIDTTPRHWAPQGPQYYVMAQFAWDPFHDGAALMDEYYRRGFGPAAENVRNYFELMEEAHVAILDTPGWRHSMGAIRHPLTDCIMAEYNPDRLARATELLDTAAAATADAPPPYGDRVAFVRTGLDYTVLFMNILHTMATVRESGGRDRAAVEQALELCARREDLFKRYDGLAVNGYLFNITWTRSRGLEDYVGPPSETYLQAAGLKQVCRWTGRAGDDRWSSVGNWEQRDDRNWTAAVEPPGAMAHVILDDAPEADAPQEILLDREVVIDRLIMAAGGNRSYVFAAAPGADAPVLKLADAVPLEQAVAAAQTLRLAVDVHLVADGQATLNVWSVHDARVVMERPLHAAQGVTVAGAENSRGVLEWRARVEAPAIQVEKDGRVYLNTAEDFGNFRAVAGTVYVRHSTQLARGMNQFGRKAVVQIRDAGANDVVAGVGDLTRGGQFVLKSPSDGSTGRLMLGVGTINPRAGRIQAPAIDTGAGTFVLLGGDQPGPMRADLAAGIHGAGGLIKTAAGDLRRGVKKESVIGERNTYTGGTRIESGTLRLERSVIPEFDVVGGGAPQVEYAGCLGPGTLEVAAGAVFDLNGLEQTVVGLRGAGTVWLNGGTLTVTTPETGAFTGEIKGPGTLIESEMRNVLE